MRSCILAACFFAACAPRCRALIAQLAAGTQQGLTSCRISKDPTGTWRTGAPQAPPAMQHRRAVPAQAVGMLLKQSRSLNAVPPSRMLVELVSSATAQDLDALCDQLQCAHKYFHVFHGAAAAVRAGNESILLARSCELGPHASCAGRPRSWTSSSRVRWARTPR